MAAPACGDQDAFLLERLPAFVQMDDSVDRPDRRVLQDAVKMDAPVLVRRLAADASVVPDGDRLVALAAAVRDCQLAKAHDCRSASGVKVDLAAEAQLVQLPLVVLPRVGPAELVPGDELLQERYSFATAQELGATVVPAAGRELAVLRLVAVLVLRARSVLVVWE